MCINFILTFFFSLFYFLLVFLKAKIWTDGNLLPLLLRMRIVKNIHSIINSNLCFSVWFAKEIFLDVKWCVVWFCDKTEIEKMFWNFPLKQQFLLIKLAATQAAQNSVTHHLRYLTTDANVFASTCLYIEILFQKSYYMKIKLTFDCKSWFNFAVVDKNSNLIQIKVSDEKKAFKESAKINRKNTYWTSSWMKQKTARNNKKKIQDVKNDLNFFYNKEKV